MEFDALQNMGMMTKNEVSTGSDGCLGRGDLAWLGVRRSVRRPGPSAQVRSRGRTARAEMELENRR